jgi:putative ABC transport system substrate-binding protein
MSPVRRRPFLLGAGALLAGGGLSCLSLLARAQRATDQARRVGILISGREVDESARQRLSVFKQRMREFGWIDGQTVRYEVRWAGGRRDGAVAAAKALAAFAPAVVLTVGTPATDAMRRQSPNVPIVFAVVADPVGDGFIASFSRPGGKITGFTTFDSEILGKWLSLLKESAPHIARAALLFNPRTAPFSQSGFQRPLFERAARRLALEPVMLPVHDVAETKASIRSFARTPGGSLVVMPDAFLLANRAAVFELAAKHRLPAIYPFSVFAFEGGLLAYGPDMADLNLRAAAYVDRILKGAQPADLPVQAPTKFELVVNLKTASARGLTIPQSILIRADRVIE